MKSVDVDLPLWKWNGIALVGGSSRDFAAWAKSSIGATVDTGDHACGHAYVEMGKPWLLWVEDLRNIPSLAHEALHVTSGVLEGRGLKHTDASEEAYTYTMEDILRQILSPKARWRRLRRV